jgi:hypothetical protein
MSNQSSYLYGVASADAPKDFGPIGLDDATVRTICEGGMGIVASPASLTDFSQVSPEKTLQSLARHQRVLERVMQDSPVIPLKFGTYAQSNEQALDILRRGRSELAAALDEFGGKVEMDLAASWTDLQAVLGELATEEAIRTARAALAGQTVSLDQRLQVGRLVKKMLDERRESVASRLSAALRAVCAKVCINPPKDDSTVLSAAVLIGRQEQQRLEGVLDQLDHANQGRLRIRCIGPLPPYSFAMAEVRAVEGGMLEESRRVLNLPESASLVEIKSAYRRLLRDLHPDRNTDPAAASLLQNVSAAYQVLEEHAMNFRHVLGGTAGGGVIVRIRSLEDLRTPATSKPAERRETAGPVKVGIA